MTNVSFSAMDVRIETPFDARADMAKVVLNVQFPASLVDHVTEDLFLDAVLLAPNGSQTASITLAYFSADGEMVKGIQSIPVSNPLLWTAETPYLYTLNLTFRKNNTVIDSSSRKIGLREVRFYRNEVLLSNQPVSVRGIHYEPAASNDWSTDLQILKDVNANAIRIRSDKPDEEFLSLCDAKGFYVVAPYSSSYETRVANHPSFIAWDASSTTEEITGKASLLTADQALLDRIAFDYIAGGTSERGIVNPDRTLGPEFYLVRSSYSPVQIEESERVVKPGFNSIELTLHNNFDFTNLTQTVCRWTLVQDGKPLDGGNIFVSLPARETFDLTVDLTIPEKEWNRIYTLRIDFLTLDQRMINRHTTRLVPQKKEEALLMRLDDLKFDENWTVDARAEEVEILHRDFLFRTGSPPASWFMMNNERNVRLITAGPYIRIATFGESDEHPQIHSSLIKKLWADNRKVDRDGKNFVIETLYRSLEDGQAEIPFRTLITLLLSPYGYLDVSFTLFPNFSTDDIALCGLSFLLPEGLNRIVYAGNGPYASNPLRQWSLNSFGLYSSMPTEQVTGNRSGVELVSVTNERGYGFGMMMLAGNVEFDTVDEGTMVHIHSFVRPDKGNAPFRGSAVFRLIPVSKNRPYRAFEPLLDLH